MSKFGIDKKGATRWRVSLHTMSIGKTREFLYWLNRLLGDSRLIRQLSPLSGLSVSSIIRPIFLSRLSITYLVDKVLLLN